MHLCIYIYIQGRPGTARHGGPADLWHGPARKIMARKNIGTARHGKYWHGKIMAWHDAARKNIIKLIFWGNKFGSKNPGLFARIQNPTFSHP